MADFSGSKETWVKQINHFYSDIPKSILSNYEASCRVSGLEQYRSLEPKLWKTLGDELIFCARVSDLDHLKILLQSFIKSLKNYGYYLDERNKALDVKGCAWICSFPDPNITVKVFSTDTNSMMEFDQLTDEDSECEADDKPHRFDFLGRHVDAGFRLAKFAKHEGLSITAELAYLLGLCCKKDVGAFNFEYQGLEPIKGLVGNGLYPVFLVDVERDNARRLSRSLEWNLLGKSFLPGHQITSFLEAFFDQESIELPVLAEGANSTKPEPPQSHKEYLKQWLDDNIAKAKAIKTETQDEQQAQEIATVDNDTEAGARDLKAAFEKLLAALTPSGSNTPSTPATQATPSRNGSSD